MYKLRYDFNYLIIPDSIYHFSYDKCTNILIENNQILLRKNDCNKINTVNLMKLEKRYLKKISKEKSKNFSFFDLINNNKRKIKTINNNNVLYKININKNLNIINNRNLKLEYKNKEINISNIFTNLIKNKGNILIDTTIKNILSEKENYIKLNLNNIILNKNITNKVILDKDNNNKFLSRESIKNIEKINYQLLKNNIKNIKTEDNIRLKNNLRNIIIRKNKLLKRNNKDISINSIKNSNIIKDNYSSNEYNNTFIKHFKKTSKNMDKIFNLKLVNKLPFKKTNINENSNILNKYSSSLNKNIFVNNSNIFIKKYNHKNINKYTNYDIIFNKNISKKLQDINFNNKRINKKHTKNFEYSYSDNIVSRENNSPFNISDTELIKYIPKKRNIQNTINNIVSGKIFNRNIFEKENNLYLDKNHNKNININNSEIFIKKDNYFKDISINNSKTFIEKSNYFKDLYIDNFEIFIEKNNYSKNMYINNNNKLKFIEKCSHKNLTKINNVNFLQETMRDIYLNKFKEFIYKSNKHKNWEQVKSNVNVLLEKKYRKIFIQENENKLNFTSDLINRKIYVNNQEKMKNNYSNNKSIHLFNEELLDGDFNKNKTIKVDKTLQLDKLSNKSYYMKSNNEYLLYNKEKDFRYINTNKDIKLNTHRNKKTNNNIYLNKDIKLNTYRNKHTNNNISISLDTKLNNSRNQSINNNIHTNNSTKLNKIGNIKIKTNKNISIKKDTKNIISNNHINKLNRETTKNIKVELNKESFGELYKSLWFIKGIGETDLKILPNTDFDYPAMIDIFVEQPNFTYLFEYESKFDIYFDDEYIIELYDYDYNMISMLKIPRVKELETQNEIIKLKIEKVVLNQLNENEKHFKFRIEVDYPELSYIIIRQPVDNYVNSVLYTVTRKFLGENRHPIPFGNDLGIREIPVHINIMIEFINILTLIWQHRFLAFSGQTGIQAIYGLVNLVYEWLNLETSKSHEYIDGYYRCFRWLRWESEKVYNIAKADPKLNGNKWINFVINEMIDYMEMHHVDVIPMLEDIRNTDDWRNIFGNATFDIKFMLDKFKGERKRLSDNNYRMTSAKTI